MPAMKRLPEKVSDLNPKEIALLVALRHKYRFGDVVVKMRDGVPQRLERVTEFDDLGPVDPEVLGVVQ